MVAIGISEKPVGFAYTDVEQGIPSESQNTETSLILQYYYSYNGADLNGVTRTPSACSLRDPAIAAKRWKRCGIRIILIALTGYLVVFFAALFIINGGWNSSGNRSYSHNDSSNSNDHHKHLHWFSYEHGHNDRGHDHSSYGYGEHHD